MPLWYTPCNHSPKGVLPQPADVIDNTMEIYDNEVLIDV